MSQSPNNPPFNYRVTKFYTHFQALADPRVARTRRHDLMEVLIIALLASICGADTFTAMEDFGVGKEAWLRTFLDLPGGIPSHDTFGRIFARLDPEGFRQCFTAWTQEIHDKTQGRILSIDGKKVRRSYDTASGKAPLHVVSAWTSQNGLVLAQVATEDKSNEITAIPRLLELLDLGGNIVTIDAIGTQKQIAQQIIAGQGDYVLALKKNQPSLYEDVELFLNQAVKDNFMDAFGKPIPHSFHQSRDCGHGRIETRRCWCTPCIEWLEGRQEWAGLRTLVLVEAERTIKGKGDMQSSTTTERRMYISSLAADARKIGRAIRSHWGIENSLHWVLDMTFNEDSSRVRKDHAAQNLTALRHITLNMIKLKKNPKLSLASQRRRAAWSTDYMLDIIFD